MRCTATWDRFKRTIGATGLQRYILLDDPANKQQVVENYMKNYVANRTIPTNGKKTTG